MANKTQQKKKQKDNQQKTQNQSNVNNQQTTQNQSGVNNQQSTANQQATQTQQTSNQNVSGNVSGAPIPSGIGQLNLPSGYQIFNLGSGGSALVINPNLFQSGISGQTTFLPQPSGYNYSNPLTAIQNLQNVKQQALAAKGYWESPAATEFNENIVKPVYEEWFKQNKNKQDWYSNIVKDLDDYNKRVLGTPGGKGEGLQLMGWSDQHVGRGRYGAERVKMNIPAPPEFSPPPSHMFIDPYKPISVSQNITPNTASTTTIKSGGGGGGGGGYPKQKKKLTLQDINRGTFALSESKGGHESFVPSSAVFTSSDEIADTFQQNAVRLIAAGYPELENQLDTGVNYETMQAKPLQTAFKYLTGVDPTDPNQAQFYNLDLSKPMSANFVKILHKALTEKNPPIEIGDQFLRSAKAVGLNWDKNYIMNQLKSPEGLKRLVTDLYDKFSKIESVSGQSNASSKWMSLIGVLGKHVNRARWDKNGKARVNPNYDNAFPEAKRLYEGFEGSTLNSADNYQKMIEEHMGTAVINAIKAGLDGTQ
ncbi:hypothetical protein [Caldisericum sp.]|uniref:hypothetical protein n=1 Tax=Caldisericum sp. TaxID=2499687 RepID=UPI003D145BED